MKNLKHTGEGRRQLYIYFWDGTRRLYPDLTVSQVSDLFAEKRGDMSKKCISPIRKTEIQEFINGNLKAIHEGPSYGFGRY